MAPSFLVLKRRFRREEFPVKTELKNIGAPALFSRNGAVYPAFRSVSVEFPEKMNYCPTLSHVIDERFVNGVLENTVFYSAVVTP